jgi:hypothetical protein
MSPAWTVLGIDADGEAGASLFAAHARAVFAAAALPLSRLTCVDLESADATPIETLAALVAGVETPLRFRGGEWFAQTLLPMACEATAVPGAFERAGTIAVVGTLDIAAASRLVWLAGGRRIAVRWLDPAAASSEAAPGLARLREAGLETQRIAADDTSAVPVDGVVWVGFDAAGGASVAQAAYRIARAGLAVRPPGFVLAFAQPASSVGGAGRAAQGALDEALARRLARALGAPGKAFSDDRTTLAAVLSGDASPALRTLFEAPIDRLVLVDAV